MHTNGYYTVELFSYKVPTISRMIKRRVYFVRIIYQ